VYIERKGNSVNLRQAAEMRHEIIEEFRTCLVVAAGDQEDEGDDSVQNLLNPACLVDLNQLWKTEGGKRVTRLAELLFDRLVQSEDFTMRWEEGEERGR